MILRPCTVLSAWATAILFARSALADIAFSSPSAGQSISGSTINVQFTEGSGSPSISDFTSYTLQLCAGGNDATDFTPLLTFTDKGDPSQSSFTAQITSLTIGGNTQNAYFLRTIGVVPGGTIINYSKRFTLSDMTGEFSAAVQAGLAKVSGTDGPATDSQIADPQNAAVISARAVDSAVFQIPYGQQTGLMYYAPMAVKPPSQITATGNARQFPTSAYTVFHRSGTLQPSITGTITAGVDYTAGTALPTMAAASPPDDMQKFLNRWKD